MGGAGEVIPNGAGTGNTVINGDASLDAILDLNGQSETLNGLSSAGTLTHAFVQNALASTTSTLTVGDNDQTATYGGTLRNNGGALALTKRGAGTQTLTGANNYTGPTNVNAGSLLINGSNIGAGLYTVSQNALLGGTGSIAGDITADGVLSPGASIESLDVTGNVTANATGVLHIELNDADPTTVDRLNVTGNLSAAPGTAFSLSSPAAQAASSSSAPTPARWRAR